MEGKEMSSCDEYTLEFFVEDSFFGGVTDEQLEKIVHLLEPEREWIEDNMIFDFDEDYMSWRSYRNNMWYTLDPIYEKRIDTIVGKK
jgi:hypothetical protein